MDVVGSLEGGDDPAKNEVVVNPSLRDRGDPCGSVLTVSRKSGEVLEEEDLAGLAKEQCLATLLPSGRSESQRRSSSSSSSGQPGEDAASRIFRRERVCQDIFCADKGAAQDHNMCQRAGCGSCSLPHNYYFKSPEKPIGTWVFVYACSLP